MVDKVGTMNPRTCEQCGRAYKVLPAPEVGQYWDGEQVRRIGVCSICNGPTVALNMVIVHQHHVCDSHAPIDAAATA